MTRSSNRSSEQVQQAVPGRGAATTETLTPEAEPQTRIPFIWRLMIIIWAVSFAILILYEVYVLIGKLFVHAS